MLKLFPLLCLAEVRVDCAVKGNISSGDCSMEALSGFFFFSLLLQPRCWFLTGTNVLSFKTSVEHRLMPCGWAIIILSDWKVEKCQLVSADRKTTTTVFFSLPIYGFILIRGKGWLVSLHRNRNFLLTGEKNEAYTTLCCLFVSATRVPGKEFRKTIKSRIICAFGMTDSQMPLSRSEFYSESQGFNWTNDAAQT